MALITTVYHDQHIPRPRGLLIAACTILLIFCQLSLSDALSESEILLKFRDSLSNNNALSNWNESKPPCPTGNWAGVYCINNTVWGLKLQDIGLKGNLRIELLKDLRGLRTISVMGNELEGEFPNFRAVSSLKNVYMSNNKFSGEIRADAFLGMFSLKKFYAANNQFEGLIPASLAVLPRLIHLRIENNRFRGEIPNFQQKNLKSFNVSNNQLEGPIPDNLDSLDASSFAGNTNLCGGPLGPCRVFMAKLPVGMMVVSAVAAVAALAAIVVAFVILYRRRQVSTQNQDTYEVGPTTSSNMPPAASADLDSMEQGSSQVAAKTTSFKRSISSSVKSNAVQNPMKLTFLRDDRMRFNLSDLLRASAEVLGSGMFGSTYKAVLDDGSRHGGKATSMVVKRYRKMNNVAKEDFQEHMRKLGKFRHPNLLPFVAYYYRKEEKLLVSDYVDNGSLAFHLHGGSNPLDWGKRLRIVKGVTQGLLYLYKELPSLIIPHGHLKSANVVLNEDWEPLLSDYALSPIINQEDAQDLMVAYKSPEYQQLGRVTKKTDVWTLGILILEILTGRFPANTIQPGNVGKDSVDPAEWVNSLMKENKNWKDKVFDKDMMMNIKGKEDEQEMIKLLKIGLACCEKDVEARLDINEVVERIRNVREPDRYPLRSDVENHHHHYSSSKDEDFYSSCASEGDTRSCRGPDDLS
ncbi:hypothetical protein ACET3Z_014886 [Daucus carota]